MLKYFNMQSAILYFKANFTSFSTLSSIRFYGFPNASSDGVMPSSNEPVRSVSVLLSLIDKNMTSSIFRNTAVKKKTIQGRI